MKSIFIFFITCGFCSAQEVYRPFGMPYHYPPNARSITIVDTEIGIKAQQVCGYTDWTTAQVFLPKKLLSKQYWKNVGRSTLSQAEQAVMDLSGALPSMLACNVSPTFCHVMNQSELMASFESSLTFESCKMLDGIANQDFLQSNGLKNCIQGYLNKNSSASNSEAREACLVNGDKSGPTDKEDKINQTKKFQKENFNIMKFFDEIFPDQVKTVQNTYFSFTRDGIAFTRISKSKEMVKKFFPGVEFKAGVTLTHGGTFQPTLEEEMRRESDKIENSIFLILSDMVKYHKQQYSPKDIIKKSEHNWKDSSNKNGTKELSPLYRDTNGEETPSFLIEPEQILSLLPLVNLEKEDIRNDATIRVIHRLANSTAYLKIHERLSDIYSKVMMKCDSDPKYQDAEYKMNCKVIEKFLMANINFLDIKRKTEENIRLTQREVNDFIDSELKAQITYPSKNREWTPPNSTVPMPGR